MSTVPMRRSARTNMYVTSEYKYPPFLSGIWSEKWELVGIIDHPFYKQGPFLQWQSKSTHRTVMINRQLFYAQMSGSMQ